MTDKTSKKTVSWQQLEDMAVELGQLKTENVALNKRVKAEAEDRLVVAWSYATERAELLSRASRLEMRALAVGFDIRQPDWWYK